MRLWAIEVLLVKGFKISFVFVYKPSGLAIELASLLCDCLAYLAAFAYDVCVVGDFSWGNVDWSHISVQVTLQIF